MAPSSPRGRGHALFVIGGVLPHAVTPTPPINLVDSAPVKTCAHQTRLGLTPAHPHQPRCSRWRAASWLSARRNAAHGLDAQESLERRRIGPDGRPRSALIRAAIRAAKGRGSPSEARSNQESPAQGAGLCRSKWGCQSGRRARPARREEHACLTHVRDEQRGQAAGGREQR